MPRRPQLGRAGAAALIGLACLSLWQAVAAGTAVAVPARMIANAAGRGPASSHARRMGADAAHTSELVNQPLTVTIPTTTTLLAPEIPTGRPAISVPILMYHYIRVNPNPRDRLGFNLSVTPDDFAAQLDWLEQNGYHPVNFNDLRAYYQGQAGLPSRPVVLTFDDGYADLYTTAYPLLKKHGFKAVAYLVSGFLDAPLNVRRDWVREMDGGGLVQVGAHTVTHADLTKLPADRMRWEVTQSRSELEALVGHPVVDFCYPSGMVNATVVRAVSEAGFQTATTTVPGTVHAVADRYLWTRVRVGGGQSLAAFVKSLGPEESTVMASHTVVTSTILPRLPVTYPLGIPLRAPGPAVPLLGPQP